MTAARRRALVGLLAGVLLLVGCGLPLPDGVQRPGKVSADPRLPEPIDVLPPGPQPGATPEAVVTGFLAAQSSPQAAHGVARGFLAPEARTGWQDDAGVSVYDPRTATTSRARPDGDATLVTLTFDLLGSVGPDGAARMQPLRQAPPEQTQRYRLRQDEQGQWRLVGVPPGLTLSQAALQRSYDPQSVYFLAPPVPGAGPHLVPDLLQLPAAGDLAGQLVGRLLAGPSTALAGSVRSAFPTGTRLLSATTGAAGDVTLNLTGPLAALPVQARQDLSAQLVWTLRDGLADFTRLRVQVDGTSLDVPGAGQPQPRAAWPSYAPGGQIERPPGLALAGGALRSLEQTNEDRPPAAPADVTGAVDFATDSRSGRLAVLTDTGAARALRVGPLAGPLQPQPGQDPGLRSPTWGSGELGLWLLRTGSRPAVLLFDGRGGAPVEVAVDDLPALSGDALLRVSRDGARVALVSGGVLSLGRVEQDGAVPHVVALRRLTSGVLDVAWVSGTVLQVLTQDTEPPLLPLLRLSIDGTSAVSSGLVGVAEGAPAALAAYGDQPLLVETRTDSRSTVYAGSAAAGFEVRLRDASRPAYPR